MFDFKNQEWSIKKVFALTISVFTALLIGGTILFFLLIAVFSIGLPDVADVQNLSPTLSTEIFDRNGTSLYTIYGEENRKYVDYDKISPYVIDATIAVEDEHFWEHKGFDVGGIAQAIFHELTGIGAQRGGSTITQQYVKNVFLSPKRSYTRKIKELILSVRLEQHYPKQKILEFYLNQIPYGNNAYGVGKAAEIYFSKTPAELNLGEAAILTSLPQAPSYYNPYSTHKYSSLTKTFTVKELTNRDIQKESDLEDSEFSRGLIGKLYILDDKHKVYVQGRTDIVLRRMRDLGYINEAEKNEAWQQTQKTEFTPLRKSIRSPHFIFYVKELLEQKYGKEIMERGGLKVYTTLDWNLQEQAEKIIADRAENNEKTYKTTNSAAIVIDPKQGQILAMIGSADYFNDDIDGKVNVVIRPRLPGSSFKPIVYSQVFLNRYTPATVLYDTPVKLGPDEPQDFDGKFMGPLPIRMALGKSRNIPAVKAYFLAGEQKQIIDLAAKMGITTLDQNHDYGYPLAIGAGEVKLIDMATAFGVFANSGKRQDLYPILKIENAKGDIIEEWKDREPIEVLDPQAAYLITNILSDQSVNIGERLNISNHTVAAKTGTSTNKTKAKGKAYPVDLWTIGYTPSYVVGVWSGNSDGSATSYNADGYNVSAPIWKEIFTYLLKDKPNEQFPVPEGIKHVSVSTLTGLLPSDKTSPDKIRDEVFASFSIPTEIENSTYELEIDARTNKIATPYCPKEFIIKKTFQNHSDPIQNTAWQAGIQKWLEMNKDTADVYGIAPTETCSLHTAETAQKQPTITILAPSAYSEIGNENIDVLVSYSAVLGLEKIDYYFDGRVKYSDSSGTNRITMKVPRYAESGKKYLMSAKIYDKAGYTTEYAIEVKVR
ncbi:penicillin-binding protein [Candidatus Peregrinibacteria bacterium]|nr:penicillin-binding protein [Candidatus Peregrinibacteria bacterium]